MNSFYDYARIVGESESHSQLIDDFEDGDTSGWTGDISASTNRTFEGTYSGKVNVGGTSSNSYSTSGLPAYPEQGDTFKAHHYYDTNRSQTGIMWGGDGSCDDNNRYFARVDGTGKFVLAYESGGANSELDSTNIDESNYKNQWNEIYVEWGTNGSMKVDWKRPDGSVILSLSGTDSNYTSGGIGVTDNDRGGEFI